MKKHIAFFLMLALVFPLTACRKAQPKVTVAQTVATTVPTTVASGEPVYNYAALEDVLDKYVYDYIGGWMDFSVYNNKLFFADHQYNTGAVNYYDFSTGGVKNLAIDNENALSAPGTVSEKSVVVGTLPAGTDPIEAEYSDYTYHIYDLENGELFTLEKHFDFRIVTYLDGCVYGNDEQGNICIASRDGSEIQKVSIGNFAFLSKIWRIDGQLFAELNVMNAGDTTSYRLVKISGGTTETLVDTAERLFYDGAYFYYLKPTDSGMSIKKYDVKTDTAEVVCTPNSGVDYLYFTAGDRVYYQVRHGDYEIFLYYYDLSTGACESFSNGNPAMGGW